VPFPRSSTLSSLGESKDDDPTCLRDFDASVLAVFKSLLNAAPRAYGATGFMFCQPPWATSSDTFKYAAYAFSAAASASASDAKTGVALARGDALG